MATRTRSRSTSPSTRSSGDRSSNRTSPKRTASTRSRSSSDRSAFSWGDNASSIIGAAIAGAAIGVAANFGRKLLMQGLESTVGDWDEMLASEHDVALAIFDKMLATDGSQVFKRKMLLTKLTHALDKHAHEEEMVVYPALREAGVKVEADHLEVEHGQVKTFLYELHKIGPEAPNWLETVRKFRAAVSRHAQMEEDEIFPTLKADLDEEQNARITSLVNRDGFWMA